MRDKSRFDQDAVLRVRLLSIEEALSRLGLCWKVDRDFHPIKDSATKRLYYLLEIELLNCWSQI